MTNISLLKNDELRRVFAWVFIVEGIVSVGDFFIIVVIWVVFREYLEVVFELLGGFGSGEWLALVVGFRHETLKSVHFAGNADGIEELLVVARLT